MTDENRAPMRPDAMPIAPGLPPYTVRRSQRAKRVRLTVTARDGIVVSLPARAPAASAARAVEARRTWAEAALASVAERRAALLAPAAERLPSRVVLPGAGLDLPVAFETATAPAVARERGGALIVRGPHDAEARLTALCRWRDRTARAALPAALTALATEVSLPAPPRVTVRGQRTRWGSCSARGTVSLNRDLVFLPPHLVRYVLAHELAHLVHLNHSPAFWRLLASFHPAAPDARAELREARSFVPVWADG